jgi:hypothetical protein
MSLTMTALLVAGGVAIDPCPARPGLQQVIGRRALEEVAIHDAHGGHLTSGRSILGVIYREPIGLQWALDGELLPREDPEALSAFTWEEVKAVWIHGSDLSGSVINVVTSDEGRLEEHGRCHEVRTVPVDRAFLRRTESVAGVGNPGDGLVVIGNLVVSRASYEWLREWRRAALGGRSGALRQSRVEVAAPWLPDVAQRFVLMRFEFSGDARDLLPDG